MEILQKHTNQMEQVLDELVERRNTVVENPMEYVSAVITLIERIEKRVPSDEESN